MRRVSVVVSAVMSVGVLGVGAAGCPADEVNQEPEVVGIPALGSLTHSLDNVRVDVIGTRADGLRRPRDLDFNPEVPGELWVLNHGDLSVTTFSDTGTDAQASVRRRDPAAAHFFADMSSISFAEGMKFASCQESRNGGGDFMGPSLWSADPEIFARSHPDAVLANNGSDLGSHLDMLHESPLCMGIAWVKEDTSCCGNVYYAFEGLTGTIARYDFDEDHGPGHSFHGDGTIERFEDVDVQRVAGVPSTMVHDHSDRKLYVADTGNKRIGLLDTSNAERVRSFRGFETRVDVLHGSTWIEFVSQADGEFVAPSGVALHNNILYVADNGTGRISAFDLGGNRVDHLDLDLPEGALMGIQVARDGSIYAIDNLGERVLRLSAL